MKTIKNIISLYNFENTITIPTRLSKQKHSCLDHILTNTMENNIFSGTIKCDLSDHLPTFYISTTNSNFNDQISNLSTTNKQYIHYDRLAQYITNTNWDNIFISECLNTNYTLFIKTLQNLIAKCTLERSGSFGNKRFKYTKPWLTNALLNKIKKKYNIYRQLSKSPLNTKLKLKYNKFKNQLSTELKNAKFSYFKDSFNNCSNASETWKVINTQILNKSTSKICRVPTQLEAISNASNLICSDIEIANELNTYFTNVGPSLAKKLPTEILSYRLPDYNPSFELHPVTSRKIIDAINSLSKKKAAGLDVTSKVA